MQNIDRRKFITSLTVGSIGLSIVSTFSALAEDLTKGITRIGIIGLDTSQVTMITAHINLSSINQNAKI